MFVLSVARSCSSASLSLQHVAGGKRVRAIAVSRRKERGYLFDSFATQLCIRKEQTSNDLPRLSKVIQSTHLKAIVEFARMTTESSRAAEIVAELRKFRKPASLTELENCCVLLVALKARTDAWTQALFQRLFSVMRVGGSICPERLLYLISEVSDTPLFKSGMSMSNSMLRSCLSMGLSKPEHSDSATKLASMTLSRRTLPVVGAFCRGRMLHIMRSAHKASPFDDPTIVHEKVIEECRKSVTQIFKKSNVYAPHQRRMMLRLGNWVSRKGSLS